MTDIVTGDFETYYATDYSLTRLTTEAYIRDPRFEAIMLGLKINDEPSYIVDSTDIGAALRDLNLSNKKFIAHHAAFDGAILEWRYGARPGMYLDTLSMARPVTGNTVGCSLDALAKKFTMSEKGKEVLNAKGKRRADFTPAEFAAYAGYCKNDVDLTHVIFHIMRQFSTPQEMYIIDMMVRMFTDPVFELDRTTLLEHRATVQAMKARLLEKVEAFCGGKEGLMSNDKFAEVLDRLGVEPPMKVSLAKTNNTKTNPSGEPVLTYAFSKQDEAFKILLEHEDPMVQAVVAARLGVKSTIEETRAESFLGIQARGLLPVYYHYWGAHTGRASGGDKVNLQNLTRGGKLRASMKAPKGHVVVACDSAQIEARVVAWLAGQWDLVERFAAGADIYSEFATDIYQEPINRKTKIIVAGQEVFPHFEQGFVGKTAILGLGFGMGGENFHRQLKKAKIAGGVEFAQGVVDLYRHKYGEIVKLWKQCNDALNNVCRGYEAYVGVGVELLWDQDGIHLPNGMLIRYPELTRDKDGAKYKTKRGWVKLYGAKVVENIVQALARIVVFNQMAMIDQQVRPLDQPGRRHRVAASTHDEVIGIVPEDKKQWMIDLMLTVMKKVPKWATGLPISCEAAGGLTYGDCK
jgi:DNA polymerase